MNITTRIIGTVIGVILYPLVWVSKWLIVFTAEIFKALDKVVGASLKQLNELMGDDK